VCSETPSVEDGTADISSPEVRVAFDYLAKFLSAKNPPKKFRLAEIEICLRIMTDVMMTSDILIVGLTKTVQC